MKTWWNGEAAPNIPIKGACVIQQNNAGFPLTNCQRVVQRQRLQRESDGVWSGGYDGKR